MVGRLAPLLSLGIVGPLTDNQKFHLDRVRTSSQHLLTLVDDVLDLARVDAGRGERISRRTLRQGGGIR